MDFNLCKVDEIISRYNFDKKNLIAIIQELQKQYNYLPQAVLIYTAKKIGVSEAKIYSVATFYENFSLEPKGKYIIRVCNGTACHVRKSAPILEALYNALNLSEKKHTTDDLLFTVDTVSCLGACGLAPVMTLDGKVYSFMTPEKALELLDSIKKEENK